MSEPTPTAQVTDAPRAEPSIHARRAALAENLAAVFGVLALLAGVGTVFLFVLGIVAASGSHGVGSSAVVVSSLRGTIAAFLFHGASRLFRGLGESLRLVPDDARGPVAPSANQQVEGRCPNCRARVLAHDRGCPRCNVVFDRTLAEVARR